MKLDDLARRAAAEVGEASRKARFTVRVPGSRPHWARPAVAFAAAAIVLAVGVPLLLLYGPWVTPITEVPVTTTITVVTTTTVATTTTATTTTVATTTTGGAPAKAPAATVEELVTAYYATGNAGDYDAFRALNTDDCMHAIYYVAGSVGRISDNISHADYDFAADPLQGIEVLGESVVSGDVVAVPVAYTYPADVLGVLTGFDVLVVRHVEGGLLVGAVATFFADNQPDLAADPVEAQALVEAAAAAFNADDVEGVLALMTEEGAIWEDMTDIDTIHQGAADLRDVLVADLGFTVGFPGDLVASGRFFAVPGRHTDAATGFTYDGMYIFWIRDGKIALQAYAQGG